MEVTSVSNTNAIHDMVLASANAEPGAAELPDLFGSYPKTVMALPDEEILVNFGDYFTKEELSQYIPVFLEEGTVHGRLCILPVVKSTEMLYLNQNAFERYAAQTGAAVEDLRT